MLKITKCRKNKDLFIIKENFFLQVAATSGHKVKLVDQTDDIVGAAGARIQKSLSRVVKKKFKDDSKVCLFWSCIQFSRVC